MRTVVAFVSAVLLASSAASARQSSTPPLLIDHLIGNWVLQGTIDGKQTTHDVDAQWVLGHGYVRMHEASREKDAKGAPAYEAIVFISFDAKTGEYACLWLDTTSNAGLTNGGVGRGKPTGTTIPFLIKPTGGEIFHTSFNYTQASDSWQWVMDGESGGTLVPFARLTLTRKK
jgi:hypothetical protein